MGLFSSALKSLGSAIGDKITDSIEQTTVGKLFNNDNNQHSQSNVNTANTVRYADEPVNVVLPPISDEKTTLELFGRSVSFNLTNPTKFWDTKDSFGACEISTVFVYSPGAIPLEEEQYQSLNTAAVVFQTSMFSPENEASTRSIVKSSYGIDNTNIQRLENSIFSHKIIGESMDRYFEDYHMEYDGNFDGEKNKVYYDIYLDIKKNALSQTDIALIKHEFHTIINTMNFID